MFRSELMQRTYMTSETVANLTEKKIMHFWQCIWQCIWQYAEAAASVKSMWILTGVCLVGNHKCDVFHQRLLLIVNLWIIKLCAHRSMNMTEQHTSDWSKWFGMSLSFSGKFKILLGLQGNKDVCRTWAWILSALKQSCSFICLLKLQILWQIYCCLPPEDYRIWPSTRSI